MELILADITQPYSIIDFFKKLGITTLPKVYDAKRKTESKSVTQVTNEQNGIIYEGNRNNKLTSLAGSMRNKGSGIEAITAALLAINENQMEKPLPEDEVIAIVNSVMRYPVSDYVSAVVLSLNDIGNASRFTERTKSTLRYALGLANWLYWHNNRWEVDYSGVYVMDLAKQVVKEIFNEAAHQSNSDVMKLVSRHANTSHNLPRLKSMTEIAKLDPLMCVPGNALDANPMLLGLTNGVIDLVNGKLIANTQELLITRYSTVTFDEKAQCPVFKAFLDKIFQGDRAKIVFVQRMIGYCLTGHTDEQVYFFFFGFGATAKQLCCVC